MPDPIVDPASPVRPIPTDDGSGPIPAIALCLSGGGYRAMLFHVGTIWRLNQLGLLRNIARVSSVSGGSITAGTLGLVWKKLKFDANNTATNLEELFVKPIRALAGVTVDVGSVLEGLLIPHKSIADKVAGAYREHLFGKATLQAL